MPSRSLAMCWPSPYSTYVHVRHTVMEGMTRARAGRARSKASWRTFSTAAGMLGISTRPAGSVDGHRLLVAVAGNLLGWSAALVA